MERLARSFILTQIELAQNHLRALQTMVLALGETSSQGVVPEAQDASLEVDLEGFGEIYEPIEL
jgi:hypothetical protein